MLAYGCVWRDARLAGHHLAPVLLMAQSGVTRGVQKGFVVGDSLGLGIMLTAPALLLAK